jgi:hypothetical protein
MRERPRQWSDTERTAGQRVTDIWQAFFGAQRHDAIDRVEEIHATARIAEVQGIHEAHLLAMDNVVGVAPSLKVTKGSPTGQWALSVLVEKKVALREVPEASRVPATLGGVPTDVVEVGHVEALVFNARLRPALPGYSIGHHNITAGTFGCLVGDTHGDHFVLSNNHVLADVNAGKPGDLILQPGPFDGGVYPADGIATLERFEPIVFGMSGYNLVDAALARPTYSRNVTASILGVLVPRGVDQAFVGGLVIKAGRTTQITVGRVLAVNATISVGYGAAGVAQFRHQIITTAMAAGGDSGSLLMDAGLSAVGLLFAGSPVITIFNHIGDVETTMGVRPLTAPRPS